MTYILEDATIPELPNHYHGKVRDCYDLDGDFEGTRLIITTDRLSAFDRSIACIPEKGRVLTETANYWFRNTVDICPNHLLATIDPNVILCRKLKMLPVEIVVRDYLAGTTNTSILQMYHKGLRYLYGYTLPSGLRDYEMLPTTVITPTTKSDDHDVPLNSWDVIDCELMTMEQWTQVCRISLDLFAFGKKTAARNGLILADTKYEFGLDETGAVVLADEIHTPDSSRYWFAETYGDALKAGTAPQSFDKDVVRRWISERCDPYKDPIPEVPIEVRMATSQAYIDAYTKITGLPYTISQTDIPILKRIRDNLRGYGVLSL